MVVVKGLYVLHRVKREVNVREGEMSGGNMCRGYIQGKYRDPVMTWIIKSSFENFGLANIMGAVPSAPF